MSYTLRGRIESRLAAALLPFLAACVASVWLHTWWPVELLGVMVGVGLGLDVLLYHRLLPYQPGWTAVPVGLLELGATMTFAWALGISVPLAPALWLFAGSWLVAQLFGHAVLPFARLSYAEDGGELGRSGQRLLLVAPAAVLVVLGTAAATQPPTILLEPGVHAGPVVLDRAVTLVGRPGTVIRGGIVIKADDVTVRNIVVSGGEYGVAVEGSRRVVLEDVTISSPELDGINARRSSLTIRDCRIRLTGELTQGIDLSFAFDLPPSRVEGCSVVGGQEGIVSHMSHVDFRRNHVRETSLRAIAVTEMSMGRVTGNTIEDAVGVGIYCGDYSHCEIEDNTVAGTRADMASSDRTQHGHAILSQFFAIAEIEDNVLEGNANDLYASGHGKIRKR